MQLIEPLFFYIVYLGFFVYTNYLKDRFLIASAFSQNVCLRARLAYWQWSLAPDENSEEPSCQIPDSSSSLCINLYAWIFKIYFGTIFSSV